MVKKFGRETILATIGILLLSGFLVVGAVKYKNTTTELKLTQLDLASSTQRVAELEQKLVDATDVNSGLQSSLSAEAARNNAFQSQISQAAGTLSRLDKLSRLDSELLKKYSKIYFLNENFSPESFARIPDKYVASSREEMVHSKVWPYLEKLLIGVKGAGLDLRIVSAYRSFETQAGLKSAYTVIYGEGANKFSADQGYSEHQLGTTVDFNTPQMGAGLGGFDETKGYQWLLDNAHRYGFVLSYPKGNSYYMYEPWHWRFVGMKLATALKQSGKNFYDMDQREIDAYLIDIFD